MKKKYRRAVCFTLIGIPYIITLPFICIGWLMESWQAAYGIIQNGSKLN